MVRRLRDIMIFILVCSGAMAVAQTEGFTVEPDTVEVAEPLPADEEQQKARLFAGRPGKAALYSLVIPGAGQIYNKRWWKAPIVWGGVGTAYAVVRFNTDKYQCYRDAYIQRLTTDMEGMEPIDKFNGSDPEFPLRLSADQIRTFRDRFNRFRQTSIIVMGLVWVAQSAEAFVDGHLREFDISDDLTLEVRPAMIDATAMSLASGIVLRF
ncbi:MAG: DUF5683 domain-containing protein [Saprospiraceae bacterium]|nr:DUF5683 domain-containing protein [Saprospiraceae bacterium]